MFRSRRQLPVGLAIRGAKIATRKNSTVITKPVTASGLRRSLRTPALCQKFCQRPRLGGVTGPESVVMRHLLGK